MRAWALALGLSLFAVSAAHAADLKVATWNLNWLTTRQGDLPADVKIRQPEDFEQLHAYAMELDADVIAIQEVDNAETAARLFPPDQYSIHMGQDRVRQRVGIAVRRGIPYDVFPDVSALALDPVAHLRGGVDIALRLPAGPLRILAVHLKQGCNYAYFGKDPRTVCLTLMAQFDIVTQWIAARRDEGTAFLVLGDFNRDMDKNDPFVTKIQSIVPLTRATEGHSSPCWGHESFIDHILIGGPARDWVTPDSLRVLTYRETDPSWKERLSDHCPVSIRLTVPG